MSKTEPRGTAEYWSSRLFRNSFTYRGTRRWVAGWCVKIQWCGDRRTLRLEGVTREAAAREAAMLYGVLQEGGWAAVAKRRRGEGAGGEGMGGVGESGGSEAGAGVGVGVEVGSGVGEVVVGVRKYVSDYRDGFERELFAEIERDGVREQVALGTEDMEEGRVRAFGILGEVERRGVRWLRQARVREVTVAVFWQGNPMTCTYTTLLTAPGEGEVRGRGVLWGKGLGVGGGRGWRVIVVEPDGPVRRALVGALAGAEGVGEVRGVGGIGDEAGGWRWDLALAGRGVGPSGLRQLERVRAARGWEASWVLEHGVYADSDAIFASVSGVSRGYFLKRQPPAGLLEPLLKGLPEGPVRQRPEAERLVRRYFQATLEPADAGGDGPGPAFSVREIQVLDLLGRGCSDKEIGSELGISVWTVHSHLKRIFAKYGVRTRTEAVVRHLQK